MLYKTIRASKTTLLVLSILILITCGITEASLPKKINPWGVNEKFDGESAITLLNVVISSILSNDFESSHKALEELSALYVPKDITYMHMKVINCLNNITYLIRNISLMINDIKLLLSLNLINESKELVKSLKRNVVMLFSIKYDLIDEGLIDRYIDYSLKTLKDPALRFKLKREVQNLKIKLDEYINELRLRALRIITAVETYGKLEEVYIELRLSADEVLGGESLIVYGLIKDAEGRPVTNGSVTIGLSISGYVSTVNVKPNKYGAFMTALKVPTFNEVKALVLTTGNLVFKGRVYAYYIKDGKVLGYTEVPVIVKYLKLKITIDCPTSVYYGDDAYINITSNVDEVLNMSVFLDGVLLINNTALSPGASMVVVPWYNLSLGYHTLSFIVESIGPYSDFRYSCAIGVSKRVPTIILIMDYISIFPLGRVYVEAQVLGWRWSNYTEVSLLIDGHEVFKANTPEFNLTISAPFSILMDFHTATVVIRDRATGAEYEFSKSFLVINPVSLLVVLALSLVMLAYTPGPGLIAIQEAIRSRIGWALRRASGKIRVIERKVSPIFFEVLRGIKFRVSRILGIYSEALSVVAKYVGEPSPSETLREYLSKLSSAGVGEGIKKSFTELTYLTEYDLYSRYGVSDEEIDKARKLLKVIKREGEGG